ncbi:hypothetical protein BGZ63DRAFT_465761 [Mariannaea sp. PMI_226]|nr:hypothetical protein BGZ63DRAFT_465761 [Mariannaea sp. PMI_226]
MNSQIAASFFSAKNENSIGLLNAQVDFSLVRVEIPKQFEGLCTALSPHRRDNAERGSQHRTARRLGALFEQIIPNIDILAAAYGERANDYGPFSNHVGVDGTSIYAAVSSGSHVIALHLLACMLARIFSSSEATAIWAQLVECRLNELEKNSDASQLNGLTALYAAEHGRQILRNHLAEWDASARAWLQAANQIKKREDTQLKLIVKNILSISSHGTTYSNVVENWIVAMTTTQKLIQGVPQDITNSSVLLGLMSWHIYPDLNVFSPNRFVSFEDKLVNPGGVVTLGLEPQGEGCAGVNWSVSLSHLRYYGDPVIVKKSSEEDSDRVTSEELQYISFGCVLASWANPGRVNIMEAAESFAALGDVLGIEGEIHYEDDLGWIAPLIETARRLLLTVCKDRETAVYFVEFGRRRGRKFLDHHATGLIPLFGLASPLIQFCISTEFTANCENTEASIASLRQLARDCNFNRHDCIIISRPRWRFTPKHTTVEESVEGNWEMASAIPTPRFTGKRSEDGTPIVTQRHTRWLHVDRTRDPMLQRSIDLSSRSEHSGGSKTSIDGPQLGESSDQNNPGVEFAKAQAGTSIHSMIDCRCLEEGQSCDERCLCAIRGFRCTSRCSCMRESIALGLTPHCSNMRDCKTSVEGLDEDCFWLSVRSTQNMNYNTHLQPREMDFNWQDPPVPYFERHFMTFTEGKETVRNVSTYGANSVGYHITFRSYQANGTAGLFLTDKATVNTKNISLPELANIFRTSKFDVKKLRKYLANVPHHGMVDNSGCLFREYHHPQLFFKSLKAMSAVTDLYREWPEATISISITKEAIGTAEWASYVWDNVDKLCDSKTCRSVKFACIAMLESGGYDIHPRQTELVMAIATGSSIYASEALLQDPVAPDKSGLPAFKGIRRIFGNLGHAGVVMLIPPPTPRKAQLDQMRNRMHQGLVFDGCLMDDFSETSLHLKFTEFNVPLASGPGAVDADVVMREALISVYDGSRWIGDLNILQAFESSNLIRLPGCNCERREEETNLCQLLVQSFDDQLKAITAWNEVLLCKENLIQGEIGVARMYGNWFARLAAACLASRLDCQAFALPSHSICHQCGNHIFTRATSYSRFLVDGVYATATDQYME